MFNRLDTIVARFKELETELTNPDVLNNYNLLKELSKERSDLEPIVNKYQEYLTNEDNIKETKSMLNDPELKAIAEEEYDNLNKKKEEILKELEFLLVPKDENDGKNVIMEIRGAAGGDAQLLYIFI